ncbi:transposase [Marinomonas arenicola]|uniref:Transposase n=1 Tax=Marinomonas arenicola TaxID=569601 RepID=A0ABU9G5M3_9GAMM
MTKPRKPNFSLEFRLESAQLFIEQNYSVAKSAETMGIDKSIMDK